MVVEFFASLKTQKRPLGFSLIKILLQPITLHMNFIAINHRQKVKAIFFSNDSLKEVNDEISNVKRSV